MSTIAIDALKIWRLAAVTLKHLHEKQVIALNKVSISFDAKRRSGAVVGLAEVIHAIKGPSKAFACVKRNRISKVREG